VGYVWLASDFLRIKPVMSDAKQGIMFEAYSWKKNWDGRPTAQNIAQQ